MGYVKPEKEYKAEYYVKNIELYRERNRKYRAKQKAIKDGTYVEPKVIIQEKSKCKNIIVSFL